MGLFDKEDAFLTQERDKLARDFVTNADYRTTDNPFRMLGGALKSYNLKNSPEAKQMRETEAIMGKYNDLISSADPTEQKQGWISIAKETGAIGNQKGAFMAMQQANSIVPPKPAKLDTSVQELGGRKLLIDNQTGSTIKDLGAVTEKEDTKLYELENIGGGKFRHTGNRIHGDKNTIHDDPEKIWHTSPNIGGGDVSLGEATSESSKNQMYRYVDTQLKEANKKTAGFKNALRNAQAVLTQLEQDPTSEANLAATKNMASVFASNVKAMADQKGWENLGGFADRISGWASNLIAGHRTPDQIKNMQTLLIDYDHALTMNANRHKAEAWDKHEMFGNLDKMTEERYAHTTVNGKKIKIDKWVPENNNKLNESLREDGFELTIDGGKYWLKDYNTSRAKEVGTL